MMRNEENNMSTVYIYQANDATKIVDGEEVHNLEGARLNMTLGADRWKPEYMEAYKAVLRMSLPYHSGVNAAERAFFITNTGNQAEYETFSSLTGEGARSLSVGDIVEVEDDETHESVYFICDTFGFRQMEEVSFGTFELAA
jgi:hypothetical protein